MGDGAIEKAIFGPMSVVENDTLIVRKDLAVIIDAPPRFVRALFRPVRSGLSKPQFHHFWTLVLGILGRFLVLDTASGSSLSSYNTQSA